MKKSWMIGVMLLGALTTQAQWKITPEAGFNVTKYTNSPAKLRFRGKRICLAKRIILCAEGKWKL